MTTASSAYESIPTGWKIAGVILAVFAVGSFIGANDNSCESQARSDLHEANRQSGGAIFSGNVIQNMDAEDEYVYERCGE